MAASISSAFPKFRSPSITLLPSLTVSSANTTDFLSNFIGTSISQTSLSALNETINYFYTVNTGNVGTFNITVNNGTNVGIFRVGDSNSTAISSSEFIQFSNPKQDIRSVMRRNILIKINSRSAKMGGTITLAEEKARSTLRDMLTERDWRRYLTNGFIMVKGGQSDYWYQIFAAYHERVRVYYKGVLTHNICIHSDQKCPPSDHVINLKILVELDEMSIWSGGAVSAIPNAQKFKKVTPYRYGAEERVIDAYNRLKSNVHIASNGNFTIFTTNSDQLALAC